MEKNNKLPKEKENENPYHISYENYLNTNACTECTGLMPNGADSRQEWEDYREIFDFIPLSSRDEDCDK